MTLLEQLKAIGTELETESQKLDTNNMGLLEEYLLKLARLKAKVNMLIPETQWYYDEQLALVTEKITETHKDNLQGNSSFIKNLIQGEMRNYARVVKYSERISSTIERQSENIRTVLSALKQEFKSN